MGLYSDIVAIIAPANAVAGSTVDVEVRIKNLCGYAINLTATKGQVNDMILRFGPVHRGVGAGQIASWYDSFVMPDEEVTISVESWYEGTSGTWQSDGYAEKDVELYSVPSSEFGSISITSYERK